MKIDHLLWGVADLETGCRRIAELTGVEPSPGGRHLGFGTHNVLLALGEECYLEIIARDPTQTELRGFAKHLATLDAPRLLTWAVRAPDVDVLVEKARRRGLQPGEIFTVSRSGPDGVRMSCRLVEIGGHDAGALVPFFIQFDAGIVHPARDAAAGCALLKLVLRSRRSRELARILRLLDLGDEIEIEQAGEEEIVAEVESPRGRVELRGYPSSIQGKDPL